MLASFRTFDRPALPALGSRHLSQLPPLPPRVAIETLSQLTGCNCCWKVLSIHLSAPLQLPTDKQLQERFFLGKSALLRPAPSHRAEGGVERRGLGVSPPGSNPGPASSTSLTGRSSSLSLRFLLCKVGTVMEPTLGSCIRPVKCLVCCECSGKAGDYCYHREGLGRRHRGAGQAAGAQILLPTGSLGVPYLWARYVG